MWGTTKTTKEHAEALGVEIGENGDVVDLSTVPKRVTSRRYKLAVAKAKSRQDPNCYKLMTRGHVYLCGNKDLCFYKIGLTHKLEAPDNRVKAVQQQVPFELDTVRIWFVEFALPFEKLLHYEFEDHRLRGEWFRFAPEELEDIFQKIKDLTVRVARREE
jgi:hypothetical protein